MKCIHALLRRYLAGLSRSCWAIFHLALMQWLWLVQIFLIYPLLWLHHPSQTDRQSSPPSLSISVNQRPQRTALWLRAFVCIFSVVNIQKENKQMQKSKIGRHLRIFAINLLRWGVRTRRVMMANNSNEKTNLILKCDPSPTLIHLGQTAFEAKVYSAFAWLMFGRDILLQKDSKLIALMLKKPMSDFSVTVLKVNHIILEKAPSSVWLWVIFQIQYLKLLVKK